MSNTRAFTIIEVLIAIVLLTVAVLGSLSVAAALSRQIAGNRSYTETMATASRLISRARLEVCRGSTRGTTRDGQTSASWHSDRLGPGVVKLTVTVAPIKLPRSRVDTFSAIIPCES